MYYYEVAPNQIVRSGSSTFTYASEEQLPIGAIVQIEVGKKSLIGVVMRSVTRPQYETKSIARIVEDTPLPAHLVQISTWMSKYYATPLATVLQTILPRGLTKNRRIATKSTPVHERKRTNIVFTEDQVNAVKKIEEMSPGSAVLHGVTGSGKTAVYIELARRVIERGESVIILVPEIALTSQLVAEFSHHFNDIILTHSRQTEAQRHKAWLEALHSKTPRIVIGPRSALFMPLSHLGLVVIDECHEPSFQQEQSPRYSSLRVASKLAEFTSRKALFGSATPLVADYYLAKSLGRPIIEMNTSARKDTVSPTIQLVDMTKRANFKKHRFFSDTLLSDIAQNLETNKQTLLFHNRRGSASSTLCENCGWQAGCPRCYVPLSLHADKHELRCHVCGYKDQVPTSCPVCHHTDIIHKGIGTKLIESEIRKLFPDARIARYDGDTAKEDTLDTNYDKVYSGDIDIIIGTQVIAKGLDLPHLRTVGVIQADAGLSLPDYSSPERTFQLLSQVVGRVGRSHHETTVIIQSYQPSNPAVVDGMKRDYQAFYERTITLRRHSNFPPFCYLLKLTCVYKTEASAINNARKLASELQALRLDIEILGPTPAFYERTADTFRWQLVVKSSTRASLLTTLTHLPPKNWQFELDPLSLL